MNDHENMIKGYKKYLGFELIIILLMGLCWMTTKNLLFSTGIVFMMIICIMTLYFFRDPERSVPSGSGIVLAPADGRVIDICTQEEKIFCQRNVYIVSIFLRIWDVHVNRMPVNGKIKFMDYQKGRFHPAFLKKSTKENEQMLIGIENGDERFLIRQVAGMIARRIVCYIKPENYMFQGQRFGMIRLGSRVELAIPITYKIMIKKGQHVKAGETVIGIFKFKK